MLIPLLNIKKGILTNLKKTWPSFLLIPFSDIKKVYLQILKNMAQFLLILFSNITNLKNTAFYTNNNLHKNHYTNNSHKNHYKHKAKYIITACIPKITIKNFLLFYKKIYIYIKRFLNHTII